MSGSAHPPNRERDAASARGKGGRPGVGPSDSPPASSVAARDRYVARFGEAEAQALERAAEEHENGINSADKGADPFKWALLIAIGYQCAEVDSYRKHHGITAPWDEVREWIREEGDLGTHDGDCDYLALAAGVYNEYVGASDGS